MCITLKTRCVLSVLDKRRMGQLAMKTGLMERGGNRKLKKNLQVHFHIEYTRCTCSISHFVFIYLPSSGRFFRTNRTIHPTMSTFMLSSTRRSTCTIKSIITGTYTRRRRRTHTIRIPTWTTFVSVADRRSFSSPMPQSA